MLRHEAVADGVDDGRAAAVATVVGFVATSIPEWSELLIGMPAILVTYLFVVIRFGFGPEDRSLFRKMPVGTAIANEGEMP